jgi:hypothetical protein
VSQKKLFDEFIPVPVPNTIYPVGYETENTVPLFLKVPVKLISPVTSRLYCGVILPIPTFPKLLILI